MSDITTINGDDIIKDSRAVINSNFNVLNTDLIQAEANIVSLEAVAPTSGQKAALAGDEGTPSDANRYVLENSSLFGVIQLTAGETLNGATTPVPVYQNKSDNELYACDANVDTRYKFIGFVTSNSTNGLPISFKGNGVISGFTGLQEGEKYYVQDTVGTIGTTPGTIEILVGVAISETQLLIQKGNRYAAGAGGSLGTASGTLVVTTGFRPSLINLSAYAIISIGTNISAMSAVWVNGTITGTYVGMDDGGSEVLTNGAVLPMPGSVTNLMTFTITSVTDTGFTITWTETGTFNPGASAFNWSAKGEL